MKDFFLRRCILGLLFLSSASPATAVDQYPVVKFSGFGTLGVAYNSSREFDYIRDLLQTKGVGASHRFDLGLDSILGLQASSILSDNLEATGQVVTRRSYKGFRPEVNWLFIKYSPNDDLDFRAGRLGFDVYPLADSRNVAYSYLWVRPPVEYFGNLIISYIDGLDLVYKFNSESTQTKLKFFTGQAQEQVLVDSPNNFFSLKGSKILGGHVEYQSPHWIARIGLTNLTFNNELPTLLPLINALSAPELTAINPSLLKLGQSLSFKEKRVRYLAAGLVYDKAPWQAQIMYSRLKSQTLSFNSNESAFITVGYRTKEWTPYFTLAKTRPINDQASLAKLPAGINPQYDQLNAAVQQVSKNALSAQNTQSLGLRYNLSNTSDLKIQIDHIKNTERALVRAATKSWDGRSNIISCTFNFVFN